MNDRRMMVALLVLACLMVASRHGAAQTSAFKYQPDKVESGVVYHYVKSESDGTNEENIAVYAETANRLQVFKYHEPGTQAGLVIADLDYNLFQADRLESYRVTSATEKTLTATLEYDKEKQATNVFLTAAPDKPESTDIKLIPFHVYNFDLTSLNFMMRHLVDPKGSFRIGIADPNFTDEGPLFLYRGEVEVKYVGDEDHGGAACLKYSINGEGVSNRGGSFWVRKDGEYIQEILMDEPDNPNWHSFRLTLKRKEPMSAQDWQRFLDAHWEEQKPAPQ